MPIFTSFTPMERRLIAFVLAVITGGMVVSELKLVDRPAVTVIKAIPAEAEKPVALPGVTASGLIDINTADQAALESLPGVGPRMAADIISHRQRVGGFGSLQDLDEVPGIGPAKLSKMEPLISFGAVARPMPAVAPPVTAIAPPTAVQGRMINLNRATKAELESLHKVGPALAQRIIDYRNWAGGFRSVDQIVQVKGVGPVILQANRHLLTVN